MANDPTSTPIGEPAFFILLSLAPGPRHGYAMLKDIEALSEGRLDLSVSTLYTTLGRLQEQGLIERVAASDEEPAPGLPRKVYRLTSPGGRALEAEAGRLRGLLLAYNRRLGTQGQ